MRPRGFISDWKPQFATLKLVNQVQQIIDANSSILPITLRQIFYMLVTGYEYDKKRRRRLTNDYAKRSTRRAVQNGSA